MYKVKVNEKDEFAVEQTGAESFKINDILFDADIQQIAKNSYHVIIQNKGYTIEIVKHDIENKKFTISVNGNKYVTEVKDKYDLLLSKLGINTVNKAVKNIKAPMPGLVLDVLVKAGDKVKPQQAVLVLEAMKMENVLKSPAEAVIKSIEVTKGSTVEKNQILINFE